MKHSEPAPVIWITGLSGAGKSTLARIVAEQLRESGTPTLLLDGDEFREAIEPDLGHDPEARLKNAFRLSRISNLISRQGITVVCATMSLFPEIWSWNREHIANYRQIYLKSDKATLEARDSKGLYRQARQGVQQNIIGWDLEFTEPEDNDLVITSADFPLASLPQLSRNILSVCTGTGEAIK